MNRFRLWLGRCNLEPQLATVIFLASIALHNMLCTKSKSSYLAHGVADSLTDSGDVVEGSWRAESFDEWLPQVSSTLSRNPSVRAKKIRDKFTAYFVRQGSVRRQWTHLL